MSLLTSKRKKEKNLKTNHHVYLDSIFCPKNKGQFLKKIFEKQSSPSRNHNFLEKRAKKFFTKVSRSVYYQIKQINV